MTHHIDNYGAGVAAIMTWLYTFAKDVGTFGSRFAAATALAFGAGIGTKLAGLAWSSAAAAIEKRKTRRTKANE